jgi:putative polyhydroxyalkanoate system protein
MAHIDIRREHSLGHEAAKSAAEELASDLDESFSLNYHWEGDALHFRRSGVEGKIDVEDSTVRIQVRLGLLLLPMRGHFEQEIQRYMDEVFDAG